MEASPTTGTQLLGGESLESYPSEIPVRTTGRTATRPQIPGEPNPPERPSETDSSRLHSSGGAGQTYPAHKSNDKTPSDRGGHRCIVRADIVWMPRQHRRRPGANHKRREHTESNSDHAGLAIEIHQERDSRI